MPALLALDTSTDVCSLACVFDAHRRESRQVLPRAHNRHVLSMLARMLDGKPPSGFEAIVCGVGPGSFTGLRVAVGVAQGLAWSLDLPVIPFCSLMAQALGSVVDLSPTPRFLLSTTAAQSGLLYWRVFQYQDEVLQAQGSPQLDSPETVASCLPENILDSLVIVGSAAESVAPHLTTGATDRIKVEATRRPDAALMLDYVMANKSAFQGIAPELLVPSYVQVDIGWKKISEQPKRA